MSLLQSSVLLLAALPQLAVAVNNGLARTPQMGWNNWNSLGCDVSESLLLDTAEKLVTSGLRDLGYEYVVLDDCWSDGRDKNDILLPELSKFPRGMGHVGDEIHKLGLKFGMYSSAGEMTCARYAGSLDYEVQDAQAFARWGVDYLKYDNCFHMGRFGTPQISYNRYNEMWKAINATGRPMLYSLCNWGEDYPHTWGMSLANSWRISGDIYDSFTRPDDLCSCEMASDPHCVAPGSHCSVLNIINKVAPYADRAQPGGWNDLDMLEVGNGGMTDDEYKAHFSLWAAVKSPLLIGADLRSLPPAALTILNNPAIIAISQDPLGKSAYRVRRDVAGVAKDRFGVGEIQVWSGGLFNHDQLVVLLNAGDEDAQVSATLEEIFVADGPGGSARQVREEWEVYDLWAGRMWEGLAEKVLEGSMEEVVGLLKKENWYNATELSYKEGLKKRDERLMGKKIGVVEPEGTLTKLIPRHGVGMYRLRSNGKGGWRKSHVKDEL